MDVETGSASCVLRPEDEIVVVVAAVLVAEAERLSGVDACDAVTDPLRGNVELIVTEAVGAVELAERRLQRARELLEQTDLSIDRVAAASGLGTGAAMRERFQVGIGISPRAYRDTFRGRAGRKDARPAREGIP